MALSDPFTFKGLENAAWQCPHRMRPMHPQTDGCCTSSLPSAQHSPQLYREPIGNAYGEKTAKSPGTQTSALGVAAVKSTMQMWEVLSVIAPRGLGWDAKTKLSPSADTGE